MKIAFAPLKYHFAKFDITIFDRVFGMPRHLFQTLFQR